MNIKYLGHKDIDYTKWDLCIDKAFNGIVYAYSWYLDAVCEDWEALISEDYKYVMPLTYRKKFNIYYLYQPIVTQQLGVFSVEKLGSDTVDEFLQAIPDKFRLVEISLNSFNKSASSLYKSKTNITYQLDLIKQYDLLNKNYATNTKRNINKAKANKVSIIGSPSINDLLELLQSDNSKINKGFKTEDFNVLRRLISTALRYRLGHVAGAYDDYNNLCAAAFFITSHRKTIFLLAVSNQAGKDNRAMFLLVDDYIKNNSTKNITLDFEGSNIPGIARFYAGFGAAPGEYLSIKRNRLPWPLRFLKS